MKKVLKYAVVIICIAIILFVGYYTVLGYSWYRKVLDNNDIEATVEKIRSSDDYTRIDELPDTYVKAVVCVEDRRFYSHNGIDIISIGRAVVTNLRNMKFVEGGSTITQQVAKNLFFDQRRKLERKVAEVFMVRRLEKKYSKDEILELYVNTIYFGNNYYSIGKAARGYYAKEPNELNDFECTMLAGLPNAPSVYSPKSNNLLATERQKTVIDKMIKYKFISKAEGEKILADTDN